MSTLDAKELLRQYVKEAKNLMSELSKCSEYTDLVSTDMWDEIWEQHYSDTHNLVEKLSEIQM